MSVRAWVFAFVSLTSASALAAAPQPGGVGQSAARPADTGCMATYRGLDLRVSNAVAGLRPALGAVAADEPADELMIRWRLAVALDETGDTAGALAEATRALALAERLDDDEVAGRMTLMVKRLSAEGPTERGR